MCLMPTYHPLGLSVVLEVAQPLQAAVFAVGGGAG